VEHHPMRLWQTSANTRAPTTARARLSRGGLAKVKVVSYLSVPLRGATAFSAIPIAFPLSREDERAWNASGGKGGVTIAETAMPLVDD